MVYLSHTDLKECFMLFAVSDEHDKGSVSDELDKGLFWTNLTYCASVLTASVV
jgi:hypothetical protein